jgi:hypothetical protein
VAHTAIARLRGRAEPREDILDRLLQINPKFRVSWLPPGAPQIDHEGQEYARPAMWRVYEVNENPMRRAAGYARRQRFDRWGESKEGQERQAKNMGILYDAEDWMDGLHLIGEFSEEFFGTERMFESLKQGEIEIAPFRDSVKEAQDNDSDTDALDEMDANPEFTDLVRETAKEWYNRVKGNPSVAVTTSLRSE